MQTPIRNRDEMQEQLKYRSMRNKDKKMLETETPKRTWDKY